MRVIYVCLGDVSVYDSQVLSLLDFFQLQNVNVLLLQGYTSDAERITIENKMASHTPKKVIWFRMRPIYPFFEAIIISSIRKVLRNIEWDTKSVLHVRSEIGGYYVRKSLRAEDLQIPILIDIRGVLLEEINYKISVMNGVRQGLSFVQRKYIKRVYQHLFTINDEPLYFTAVSPIITNYFRQHYPECIRPFVCHPNIVGLQFVYSPIERQRIRQQYGLSADDVIAICSTSGNAVWQKDTQIIDLFVQMGIKVINLSNKNMVHPNVITTMVPFKDMPAMLSAADMAILWRDKTFMNKSASPSKFSEFAAMGLYVIHNQSVDIATQYIRETHSGLLVDNDALISNLPSSLFLYAHRNEWINTGVSKFGVKSIGQSYIHLYERILSNS